MKYHTSTTRFNCGIDLHARQMYVCVMDRDGKKLVHTNVRNNDFAFFLKLVAPYRHDLTVCAECMFGWYWLADACQDAHIHFVLAHALYLKAIHGGKNKNDRIDSEKLCHLLRSNLIPTAYVYPAEKRPLRALLRQRLLYVWNRSELLSRIQSHQLAYNRPTLRQTPCNRQSWTDQLLASEPDPVRQLALQNDLALIGHYDSQLASLEKELLKLTKQTASRDFTLLQTAPGIGDYLGLTILHEIGDIARFPTVKDFLSYCRLVKGTVASAGKIKGSARRQAGQSLSALGLRRSRRHCQTRSAGHRPIGATSRSAHGRQQIQGQHRAGHQAGPRRLFHAQEQNGLRPRPPGGGVEQELI